MKQLPNAQSSQHPAQQLLTPPPGESFDPTQSPPSPLPPPPLTPMELSVGSVNSWNSPRVTPTRTQTAGGFQESMADGSKSPTSGAAQATCACTDPHRQAQMLIWIWGKGPGGQDGRSGGQGVAQEPENTMRASFRRVWWGNGGHRIITLARP